MRISSTRTLLTALIAAAFAHGATAADLASIEVKSSATTAVSGFDAVVEAVRQAVVSAQVPGAIVHLAVKAGDRVAAGQVLARIDARAAEQGAAASDAQVGAARASLEVATKEYERQKALHQKSYISKSALERAEAEFKATQSQVEAQLAQAGAARTQAGLHVLRAPFSGVVAEVPVSQGDMAMPGRPLMTVYDPGAMRITASVPQSVTAGLRADPPPRIELPGLPAGTASIAPKRIEVLPAVDPATHTVQIRAELPDTVKGAVPGMFARLWLGTAELSGARGPKTIEVPREAIVRRAELTAVYVLDPGGKPVLRQVRLGRASEGKVEVLSGLSGGERVATDPQAAARVR
ncbi:MAG: hypothetical protein RIS35_1241 [Pseudomonadota bacterium]|jgi:RND family efflux transporter MFP subunit